MTRPCFLVSIWLLALGMLVPAQSTTDFALSVVSNVAIPLGPTLEDGLPLYELGGGAGLRGEFVPGFAPNALLRIGLDADLIPLKGSDTLLTLVSAGGVAGLSYSPAARISLKAWGGGGLYLGMAGSDPVRNPFWEAGGEFGIRLNPTLDLGFGLRYRDFRLPGEALYKGVSVQLGLGYDLAGARRGGSIRMEPRLLPIFPLFYTYYDKHPAGEIELRNDERVRIEKVKVSFYARQYMDGPRTCAELSGLNSGESVTLPILALFNDQIFRVTEGTKSAGEIVVDYYYLGSARTAKFPLTVLVNNRNAMTWDDDRKAAAFVAAKNPTVLAFAKSVAAAARRSGSGAATNEIRTAIALFEALRVHGIGYAVDPSTPYQKLASSETAIDFLQFPQQTLAYKAGDCDDLSVVYAALLEATGVRSAFVLVPGHVFIAFDTGLSPDGARRLFSNASEFVEREGTAWLPVEVTMVADGFLRAWRAGAREWREAEKAGTLSFFETRTAWETYEPVGISDDGVAVLLPASDAVSRAYEAEFARFVDEQTRSRVAALQADIRAGLKLETNLNRLGILYAQFGRYDEARAQFQQALKRSENAAALINLGNIAYLSDQAREAVGWYQRALGASPNNGIALLGLARSLYELEDYAAMGAAVARLKEASPELAARLDLPGMGAESTSRAAEAGQKEVEAWSE